MIALLLTTASILSNSATASQDAATEGHRAIDLMWKCEGRGPNYVLAVEHDLPDPEFFGSFDLLACAEYISGFADMNTLYVGIYKRRAFFCFPELGIATDQQIRVFMKWADEYPERLHESKRVSVVSAFAEAFPCSAE